VYLRLRNVRSIEDSGKVELKPLTLVVGRNSVGKSSFLRWLPLLAQSRSAGAGTPVVWRTRGGGVDFGSFQETVRRGAQAKEIGWALGGLTYFGKSMDMADRLASVESGTVLDEVGVRIGNLTWTVARQPGASCEVKVQGEDNHAEHSTNWTWIDRGMFPQLVEGGSGVGQPVGDQIVAILQQWKRRKMAGDRIPLMALQLGGTTAADVRKFLAETELGTQTWAENLPPPEDPAYSRLAMLNAMRVGPQALDWAHTSLNMLLDNMTYIGPFRAEPVRSERSPEPTRELDSRGSALLSYLLGLQEEERASLSSWTTEALGFGLRLHRDGLHVELQVIEADGTASNIADVGFGIGQVLPVLVHLWRNQQSQRNGIFPIIIEQPELHLHPAHQHRVGSLLARMAAVQGGPERIFMVETHSEHLVNAVGIAVRKGILPADRVNVVLFEREAPGLSRVRQTGFAPDGHLLPPWPYDFFEGAVP
jgi:hypothetical protein